MRKKKNRISNNNRNNIRTFPFVTRARNTYWEMTVRTLQREYLPYNRLASTQPTSPVCTLQHFRESQQRNPYLGLNIQRCIRAPSRFAFRFETRATKVNFVLFKVCFRIVSDGY